MSQVFEFHLDLDATGAEYSSGHCWLPDQIESIIRSYRESLKADGNGIKKAMLSEEGDREWRTDPHDGLRPLMKR